MKKMKTHYFNAFYYKDDFVIESKELSYQDALEDIAENTYTYAYTLEVGLEETKRIDLEAAALNVKYPEYEKLTGHEMGLLHGRA